MSAMTKKMSEAGSGQPMTQDAGLANRPKKGDPRHRHERDNNDQSKQSHVSFLMRSVNVLLRIYTPSPGCAEDAE